MDTNMEKMQNETSETTLKILTTLQGQTLMGLFQGDEGDAVAFEGEPAVLFLEPRSEEKAKYIIKFAQSLSSLSLLAEIREEAKATGRLNFLRDLDEILALLETKRREL